MIGVVIQFFLLVIIIFITAWYSSILAALRRAEKTSKISIPKFWKFAIPALSIFALFSIVFFLLEIGFSLI